MRYFKEASCWSHFFPGTITSEVYQDIILPGLSRYWRNLNVMWSSYKTMCDPISSRRLATQLPTSHTTTYRMMWQIAYAYKIQIVRELKPANPGKHIAFCNWLLWYVSRSHSALDTVFFSDEVWFHLLGYVNGQNYRVWSSINPHQYVETTLHPQKLGVWCAISRKRLVGHIFIQHHHFRGLSRH